MQNNEAKREAIHHASTKDQRSLTPSLKKWTEEHENSILLLIVPGKLNLKDYDFQEQLGRLFNFFYASNGTM
jgi:uncharacterized protein HemY